MKTTTNGASASLCLLNSSFTYLSPISFSSGGIPLCSRSIALYSALTRDRCPTIPRTLDMFFLCDSDRNPLIRTLFYQTKTKSQNTERTRIETLAREELKQSLYGDSLVLIFPLAPMLTFTSAVGKLNVRVLWHHHMLLQVISQRYCQVFVKSYNFVFEKIDKEGSPREKWPKQGNFCPRAMGILPPPKYPRVVKQPPKN